MTGNRCSIYEKIDALDEARTVQDLGARLKPILNELAYYAVTGEGAVMETQEEWQTTFTNRLYDAMGADYAAAPKARGARPEPSRGSAPPAHRGGAQPARRRPDPEGPLSDGPSRPPVAPPANRPRPGDLPASLRAIMEGTHPSLHENDDAPY